MAEPSMRRVGFARLVVGVLVGVVVTLAARSPIESMMGKHVVTSNAPGIRDSSHNVMNRPTPRSNSAVVTGFRDGRSIENGEIHRKDDTMAESPPVPMDLVLEDIEDAAMRVEANPDSASSADIRALATRYARSSATDALAWAMRVGDSLAASAVVEAVAEVDLHKAAALVLDMHATWQAPTSRALVESWVAVDPPSAARWLGNHPHVVEAHEVNLPHGDSLHHLLFRRWAEEDLHAASRFLGEIIDDEDRWNATVGVIDAMNLGGRRNIPLLEGLYEGLPESRRPDYAAWMLHQYYRTLDPEAAKRFFLGYERHLDYERGG